MVLNCCEAGQPIKPVCWTKQSVGMKTTIAISVEGLERSVQRSVPRPLPEPIKLRRPTTIEETQQFIDDDIADRGY